jgi:hypothetical protein
MASIVLPLTTILVDAPISNLSSGGALRSVHPGLRDAELLGHVLATAYKTIANPVL